VEKPDAVTERADDPRPINPYLVLVSAILLPGTGHVLLGQATRGLIFLFFMLVLGWATSNYAPPQASFVGRYAGGFFIYAMSVFDAYKIARVRFETWRYRQRVRSADAADA